MPLYWVAHKYFASQADEPWRMKYGAFKDFLEFFQPPFAHEAKDEE